MDVVFKLDSVNTHVQLGVPMDIHVTPLFALGETPVDDGNHTYGTPKYLQVIPNVMTLTQEK